jgi:hypothetical protein
MFRLPGKKISRQYCGSGFFFLILIQTLVSFIKTVAEFKNHNFMDYFQALESPQSSREHFFVVIERRNSAFPLCGSLLLTVSGSTDLT